MKAAVGDRILIATNRLDQHPRDGKVVRLHHPDGTPPYDVQWSDTGRTAVVFPGPDARVEHFGEDAAPVAPGSARHTRTWQVTINLFEADDGVTAHAVLLTEAPVHLRARGSASPPPGEESAPEISDEVAAGHALQRLGGRLLAEAAGDRAALSARRGPP